MSHTKYQCRMHWQINQRCNFNCPYCFRRLPDENTATEHPDCGKYGPEHIARQFNQTGSVWHIYMTGGEPLLYPHFVELAKALTCRHYIAISTNLSTANAYDLAEAVETERITFIMATLHILQRENTTDGLKDFFRKFLYFQQKGFGIRLVYVAYPPLFTRINQDLTRCRDEGVKRIEVKAFQGQWNGKRYPRDYTDRQRASLKALGVNDHERQIFDSSTSFLGRTCAAGHLGFAMDISGNVTRCITLKEQYGNLFEATFKPGQYSRRCTARTCACAYQGFALTGAPGSVKPRNAIARPVRFYITLTESIAHLFDKMR